MTARVSASRAYASFRAGSTRIDLAVLMMGALLLYGINIDFTLYGDGAVYMDRVVLRGFDELTLHLGYFLFVFLGDQLARPLGIPIQETAVWLNVLLGAISVGISDLLAREIFDNRRAGLLCAIIFAVSGRILTNATTNEIYMALTAAVLSSFYLFARGRLVLSGLLAAVALLISPQALFAFLFYPVYEYQKTGAIRWSRLFRFAGGLLVLYVPFVVVHWNELFFGVRGVLAVSQRNFPFDPATGARWFALYQFKAYTFLLLLLIPAFRAWREYKELFVLAAVVLLPHFYVISRITNQDNVFIISTDFFFACCLVAGWLRLERARSFRVVAPVLFVGHVGLYVVSGVMHGFEPNREYADEMDRLVDTYLSSPDDVLVTDWGRAVTLTFYGRAEADSTVLRDRELYTDRIFVIRATPPRELAQLDRANIYLLDGYQPTPLNEFLRSEAALAALRERNSILAIAERELDLQCELLEDDPHPLYRCVREFI
jgi:hypothetical protein